MEDEDQDIKTFDYQSGSEDEDRPDSPLEEKVIPVVPRDVGNIYWNADGGYGLKSTTAEGEYGDKIRRLTKASRTPEERFSDNLVRISQKLNGSRDLLVAVQSIIPKIPDIAYKNAAGVLLGFQARKLIGKSKLTKDDEKIWKSIENQIDLLKNTVKIDSLSVVRYARLLNKVV